MTPLTCDKWDNSWVIWDDAVRTVRNHPDRSAPPFAATWEVCKTFFVGRKFAFSIFRWFLGYLILKNHRNAENIFSTKKQQLVYCNFETWIFDTNPTDPATSLCRYPKRKNIQLRVESTTITWSWLRYSRVLQKSNKLDLSQHNIMQVN